MRATAALAVLFAFALATIGLSRHAVHAAAVATLTAESARGDRAISSCKVVKVQRSTDARRASDHVDGVRLDLAPIPCGDVAIAVAIEQANESPPTEARALAPRTAIVRPPSRAPPA